MALAETTLSSAVTAGEREIAVASATSISAGRLLQVDGEIMQVAKAYVAASTTVPVLRGLDGSIQAAHPVSARVVHGDAADFGIAPGTGSPYAPSGKVTTVTSYSAAGAIALPKPGETVIAKINGTALAMTVAAPTKDLDGSRLIIVGNAGAAHTVTFAGGLSGAGSGYDVLTFNATGKTGVEVIAVDETWVALVAPGMAGTLTNIVGTLA